jgi:hypothetical protein
MLTCDFQFRKHDAEARMARARQRREQHGYAVARTRFKAGRSKRKTRQDTIIRFDYEPACAFHLRCLNTDTENGRKRQ